MKAIVIANLAHSHKIVRRALSEVWNNKFGTICIWKIFANVHLLLE